MACAAEKVSEPELRRWWTVCVALRSEEEWLQQECFEQEQEHFEQHSSEMEKHKRD